MKEHRVSLEIETVKHNAPIPMGARVGNMIFSSGIPGRDPVTGEWPEDSRLQAKYCFDNLATMLALGGSKMGDVGHMTVFITDNAMRAHVNEFWLEHFPDPDSRPARHVLVQDLPANVLIQIEVIAVLEAAA
jgi:2-iminobutanoate/2-iminopropanoate deaminase